jgi:hypothetical protein
VPADDFQQQTTLMRWTPGLSFFSSRRLFRIVLLAPLEAEGMKPSGPPSLTRYPKPVSSNRACLTLGAASQTERSPEKGA